MPSRLQQLHFWKPGNIFTMLHLFRSLQGSRTVPILSRETNDPKNRLAIPDFSARFSKMPPFFLEIILIGNSLTSGKDLEFPAILTTFYENIHEK